MRYITVVKCDDVAACASDPAGAAAAAGDPHLHHLIINVR
jgi:hypothetical protein